VRRRCRLQEIKVWQDAWDALWPKEMSIKVLKAEWDRGPKACLCGERFIFLEEDMKIYNTKTRRKEEFVPQTPGEVRMYACGPTVYNFIHIGNARPLVLFDTLRRYFIWRGYKVTFVQNFTDIDDKLIRRANEENSTVAEIAEKYIAEYKVDAAALGALPADIHPRATEHIDEIIELISRLVEKGLAYAAGGDVYYNTQDFAAYGALSGRPLEEMQAGARVDVNEEKRHPMDFALWKGAKPGEPFWPSPWGDGRPGWHIECSAMSMKYLGETLDLHCGGQDLIFPHHENEVAQSEGATGKPFANYWMHNGFINVDNRKMSKSLGNFFTVREIGEKYDLEVVRYFMLSAHYRSPVNFSSELLDQSATALSRLYNARDTWQRMAGDDGDDAAVAEIAAKLKADFTQAMDDDFNTADGLAALFDFVHAVNFELDSNPSAKGAKTALAALGEITDVLGLVKKQDDAVPAEVQQLVDDRAQARKNKEWALSDKLRDDIRALGYEVKDTRDGQVLKKL